MKKTVEATEMLVFLKEEWKKAHHLGELLGWSDERADMHMSWCIGMKEMAETLIGVPVNLKMDGRLTIGLDSEEVAI